MTIKDSLDTAGTITTAGSRERATYIPEHDATVVARLRQAGAILLGKTNTPEITMSGETDNSIYGRTNNPYDLRRTPGGSSGGPAAVVAAKGSPFDVGSDTAGSIRWPAHCCGIAGIKPTSGRIPRTGHVISFPGALQSLTQLGPMAKTADDLALLLTIMAGEDGRDPFVTNVPMTDPATVSLRGLRVAFYTDNGLATPTSAIAEAVRSAARVLGETGARLQEARPPGVDSALELVLGLVFGDPSWMKRTLDRAGITHSPLRRWIETLQPKTLADYSALLEEWDLYRSEMLRFMQAFDVILCPAAPTPATLHGEYAEETESYLLPYNLTGWPAAVVRSGTSPEGLPLGAQIVARPWRCDVVLAVAQHLEGALGPWPGPRM